MRRDLKYLEFSTMNSNRLSQAMHRAQIDDHNHDNIADNGYWNGKASPDPADN